VFKVASRTKSISTRKNGGMFGADSLVDAEFPFSLKVTQDVPAANLHVEFSGDLVPQVFDCNCRIWIPLAPQLRCTLPTGCNPGMFPNCRASRCINELFRFFSESCYIEHAIDHVGCEGLIHIHGEIAALLQSGSKVRVGGLQCLNEEVLVWLCRKHNDRISLEQLGPNKLREPI
jgi:hypothetical protein